MINIIYPVPIQREPQTAVTFNPVVIPLGDSATWIGDLVALRLALGG